MVSKITDEDLKKIKLICPNETTYYETPTNIYNKDGTCKYAYVTVLFGNKKYVSSALALAYSIIKMGSKIDRVCLITPDFEDEKDLLGTYFTHVYTVPYIEIPSKRGFKQKYLDYVFTKIHVLNLVQYEKILLMDADALVYKHFDSLFEHIKTPAGCLYNKDLFITYGEDGGYELPKDGNIKWFEKMCKYCSHGQLIDKALTDCVLTNNICSGIGAGLLLLEPNKKDFDEILTKVKGEDKKMCGQFLWPEQQYLTAFYSGKWHAISLLYFGFGSYPSYKVLYGSQYAGAKPNMIHYKIPIEEGTKYEDFQLWHKYWKEMLEEHPEFKTNNTLSEVNKIHAYYFTPIKFHETVKGFLQKDYTKNKKKHFEKIEDIIPTRDKIKMIFNMDDNNIHENQIKYYHLNKDIDYRPMHLRPMFDNINDYLEPIKKLSKYYKENNYYLTITEYPCKKQEDNDFVMLEYIKCNPNIFVISCWTILTKNTTDENIIKIIEKYGKVHYTKKVKMSKKALLNYMFWVYDEFTYQYRMDFITKKMEYIQSADENEILFIFLESKDAKQMSGQGSLTKNKIRDELKELMQNNTDIRGDKIIKDNLIRGNDLIHINDYFYQTINYSQMILNDNTLNLLKEQNIENITNSFMIESSQKIETLKKWMYNNMSLLEQQRLLIIGGVVLYAYGIKKSNDIDTIYVGGDNIDKSLTNLLNENFIDEKTKFEFADTGIEHSEYWRDSWTEKNNKLYFFFDKNITTTEILTNPKYHFYFKGLKCYILPFEIIRKMMRNLKQDHADFIMMNILNTNLISDYIELENGQLKYLKTENEPPKLTHEYLKKVIEIIYKKYLKSSIEKLKNIL